MKIHDVFHVSLLKLYHKDASVQGNPPVVYVDGEQEYDVEHIIAHHGTKRNLQFLVHWSGFGPEHDSWETASSMRTASDAVKQYWAKQRSSGS